MKLADLSVRNRTTVYVGIALIILFGVAAYRSLPLESAPDITIPYVFVTTNYRGVSPEDIERGITIQIEKKLRGLSGVKRVSSVSAEGSSFISIEFMPGTDIDDALIKVKDKVDLAKQDLPKDLEDDPSVTEVNFAEMPILILGFSGPCGMRQLTEAVEDLKDQLEGVKGVLEAEIIGGVEREIQVQVDPDRLALYGIPFTSLQQVIASENQNVSGGTIRTREGRYQLRVPGEFRTAEEAERIVVATHQGGPVYLRDIAVVVDGIKDRDSRSRINGQDAVLVQVKKRVGENVVQIVEKVDAEVAQFRRQLPPGVNVTRIMDHSKDIRDMVLDLENNMYTGLLLVLLVVWVCMGLRNALLVSLSIPLSMLLTYLALKMLGITLNMIVLFSLTLATGMLVDNAIVIIENIHRYMSQGIPRMRAAMRATEEIAWPILGSSLTTVAAFVPLLWWTGISGEFMVYLPKTVIIVLLANLLVAVLINPATAAGFLKAKLAPGCQARSEAEMEAGLVALPRLTGGGPFLALYRWLLKQALRFRLAVITLALLALVAAILFWLQRQGLRTPIEFFPSGQPRNIYVNLKLPEGSDIDYADNLVREAACRLFDQTAAAGELRGTEPLRTYADCLHAYPQTKAGDGTTFVSPSHLPDVLYVYEKSTAGAGGQSLFSQGSDNQVGIRFTDLADRHQSSSETMKQVEALVKGIPGAEVTVDREQDGPPTGSAINIEISGDDFQVLGQLADKVKEVVRNVPFVRNVRDDYEPGMPTLQLTVNRARASLLGLSTNAIGFAIKAAINGIQVSTYRERNDDYDIIVRLREADRRNIETLNKLFIPTPVAGLVPLTTVVTIEYIGGLSKITRVNHKRVVTVKADVDETKTTGSVAARQAGALLAEMKGMLPAGYACKFTGANEEQELTQEFLRTATWVALLLITLVLVAQFNALYCPLIIMITPVLALTGAFVGMGIHRLPFGLIMGGIGIISLAGVVVNNAIVLLDYTLQLMGRGMPVNDAIVAAGATRLRPVLLTAITTMLGLVPMIVGISYDFHTFSVQWVSESAIWWKGMAVTVTYGLGLATLLTLGVVPVLFSLFHSGKASLVRLAAGASRLTRRCLGQREDTR